MEKQVEGDVISMAKKLSIVEGEKQKLQEKVDMLLKLWEIEKETLQNSLQDVSTMNFFQYMYTWNLAGEYVVEVFFSNAH
jgi:hypothetical protein